MSISALVMGTLLTQPTQRTSQRGANFVTCRIRVAAAGTGDNDSVVANAICFDDDAGAEGKVRAARMIRAVLDAAATNGCTRTEVLETLLCDYGIAPDRRRAAALELAGTVGREGFVHALQRAGIGIRPM